MSSAAQCPILVYAVTSAQCEGWWFFGLVGGWFSLSHCNFSVLEAIVKFSHQSLCPSGDPCIVSVKENPDEP